MSTSEVRATHFDVMFAKDADPWRTRTRWYERRKRALMLAMLPRERFASAFEPGCGAGETTAALALRCDRLLASDASAHAVEHARKRTAWLRNIRIEQGRVPEAWPPARFDLIVVAELGYYLDATALECLAQACAGSLTDQGCLLACHWRRGAGDMSSPAPTVHQVLGVSCAGMQMAHYEDDDLLLDVWCRDPHSVAQREGLA